MKSGLFLVLWVLVGFITEDAIANLDAADIIDLTSAKFKGSDEDLRGFQLRNPKALLVGPTWHPEKRPGLIWNSPALRRDKSQELEAADDYELTIVILDRFGKEVLLLRAAYGEKFSKSGTTKITQSGPSDHGVILPIKKLPPYGKIQLWLSKIAWTQKKGSKANPDNIAFSMSDQLKTVHEAKTSRDFNGEVYLKAKLETAQGTLIEKSPNFRALVFNSKDPESVVNTNDEWGAKTGNAKLFQGRIAEVCKKSLCVVVVDSRKERSGCKLLVSNEIKVSVCSPGGLFATEECSSQTRIECAEVEIPDLNLRFKEGSDRVFLILPEDRFVDNGKRNRRLKIEVFGNEVH